MVPGDVVFDPARPFWRTTAGGAGALTELRLADARDEHPVWNRDRELQVDGAWGDCTARIAGATVAYARCRTRVAWPGGRRTTTLELAPIGGEARPTALPVSELALAPARTQKGQTLCRPAAGGCALAVYTAEARVFSMKVGASKVSIPLAATWTLLSHSARKAAVCDAAVAVPACPPE
jgi:hypothetical protein